MKLPRKRYLVPIFILLLIFGKYISEIGFDRSPADRFKVVRIIDGDTIELAGGDRLRLLGLDTPEKGQPYYDSAKAFLNALILGKHIEVSYSKRRRDGYGRLLGYIYVDSTWVNKEILKKGLAHLYLFDDNLSDKAKIDELLSAQVNAMEGGQGLWSIRLPEEDYYLAVKGSYRFHRPTCRSLIKRSPENVIKLVSRDEAFRQGYSPCRNCGP